MSEPYCVFRNTRFYAVFMAFGVLVASIGVQADMPARHVVYADVDALQSLVVEYFGTCQGAQFATALAETRQMRCLSSNPPGYQCLDEDPGVFFAMVRLIQEAGRVKREGVDEFLERINQGKMLRGHLIARNGGDYDTTLGLEVEGNQRHLVARHHFGDGRGSTWRFPFGR